jgi:hypothetical protein
MRRVAILGCVLVACGGSLVTQPDGGDGGGVSDSSLGFPDTLHYPSGSFLAIAVTQADYAAAPTPPTPVVLRVTVPDVKVQGLFKITNLPPSVVGVGIWYTALATRPDGSIDVFAADNVNKRTHLFTVDGTSGVVVGPERVFDGLVHGADYAPDGTLWAGWDTGLVTIESSGLVQRAPLNAGKSLLDVVWVASSLYALENPATPNGFVDLAKLVGTTLVPGVVPPSGVFARLGDDLVYLGGDGDFVIVSDPAVTWQQMFPNDGTNTKLLDWVIFDMSNDFQ